MERQGRLNVPLLDIAWRCVRLPRFGAVLIYTLMIFAPKGEEDEYPLVVLRDPIALWSLGLKNARLKVPIALDPCSLQR